MPIYFLLTYVMFDCLFMCIKMFDIDHNLKNRTSVQDGMNALIELGMDMLIEL